MCRISLHGCTLLYINDLPDSVHSQVRVFVDDTAVYLAVQGQEDLDDLNKLQDWEFGKRRKIWNSVCLNVWSCTTPIQESSAFQMFILYT